MSSDGVDLFHIWVNMLLYVLDVLNLASAPSDTVGLHSKRDRVGLGDPLDPSSRLRLLASQVGMRPVPQFLSCQACLWRVVLERPKEDGEEESDLQVVKCSWWDAQGIIVIISEEVEGFGG